VGNITLCREKHVAYNLRVEEPNLGLPLRIAFVTSKLLNENTTTNEIRVFTSSAEGTPKPWASLLEKITCKLKFKVFCVLLLMLNFDNRSYTRSLMLYAPWNTVTTVAYHEHFSWCLECYPCQDQMRNMNLTWRMINAMCSVRGILRDLFCSKTIDILL